MLQQLMECGVGGAETSAVTSFGKRRPDKARTTYLPTYYARPVTVLPSFFFITPAIFHWSMLTRVRASRRNTGTRKDPQRRATRVDVIPGPIQHRVQYQPQPHPQHQPIRSRPRNTRHRRAGALSQHASKQKASIIVRSRRGKPSTRNCAVHTPSRKCKSESQTHALFGFRDPPG